MSTPTDTILETYRAVFRALQSATIADWIDLDCSMAQLKTLFVIAGEEPLPIGRVGELLRVGLPTASHLVERLVQDGLVERASDPSDRRRALARLSDAGAAQVARLRQGSATHLRGWVDRLSDDERADLARGLGALARVAAVTEQTKDEDTNGS